MLGYLHDPTRLPAITVLYSGWSSLIFIVTAYLLLSSNKFLKFGNVEILPLYGFYCLSEVLKWAYVSSKFQTCPPYGVKATRGIINEMVKQVRSVSYYNMIKSSTVLVCGVIFYYVMAILFGAAVTEGITETLLFAVLMTILTVLPVCLNLGHEAVVELVEGYYPEEAFHWLLYRGVLVAWFGAWLGAFVIPLDWGRPWQAWPVPCSYGAIVSTALYYLASCVYHSGLSFRKKFY